MSDESQIKGLFSAYAEAYNRGDADTLTALYSEDGAIYSPYGPPALGRIAIHAAHVEWLQSEETNKRIDLRRVQVNGDLAWCVAEYAGDVPHQGKITSERGTSLNVLVRAADGNWKIVASSLNELGLGADE